jgi:hypothetical protein
VRRRTGFRLAIVLWTLGTVGGPIGSGLSATTGTAAAQAASKQITSNTRMAEAFVQDVPNEHHGGHAASYLTAGMQWHGGTVRTVSGPEQGRRAAGRHR